MASTITADTGAVSGSAGLKSSADSSGVLAFATGTGTTAVTINASQNVGVGVTPSAWATVTGLQVKNASVYGYGNEGGMYANAYYNGGWKYIASAAATGYDSNASSGQHRWFTASSGTAGNAISFTQAMTLDASGNLGVGVTNPSHKIHAYGSGTVFSAVQSTTAAAAFTASSASGNDAAVLFNSGGAETARMISPAGASVLAFGTGASGTERARIDSSGYFLAGVASTPNAHFFASGGSVRTFTVSNTGATPYGHYVIYTAASPNNTASEFLVCTDSTATRAVIRSNGGIANYSANNVNLSDRREKTNFAPAKSYLDVICAIPVQTYNYIDQNMEEDGGLTLGVVAQDVQAVAPELVTESNWGTEEAPKMRLSIYQTDMQYALMKCIQEQQAIINAQQAALTTLTERISALEGATQ